MCARREREGELRIKIVIPLPGIEDQTCLADAEIHASSDLKPKST